MDRRETLHFRGSPSRVSAVLELSQPLAPAITCRAVLPETGALPVNIRSLRSAAPAVSTLSFRLPNSTPPGSYRGDVELGEERVPMVVEVEPRASLRFLCSRLVFREKPGAHTTAELMLCNRGNVAVAVPEEDKFCIFADDGLAQAMYSGLVEEDGDGKQRLDRIMDELAKAHGGLVRVRVIKGAGPVAPDEVRKLSVELHFSRRLNGGHMYRGTWSVSRASLDVQIEVIGESDGKESGR
jgi:hypothetical protein